MPEGSAPRTHACLNPAMDLQRLVISLLSSYNAFETIVYTQRTIYSQCCLRSQRACYATYAAIWWIRNKNHNDC